MLPFPVNPLTLKSPRTKRLLALCQGSSAPFTIRGVNAAMRLSGAKTLQVMISEVTPFASRWSQKSLIAETVAPEGAAPPWFWTRVFQLAARGFVAELMFTVFPAVVRVM